jgi:hypothetical protein
MPLDATHARNIVDASLGVAAFVATTAPIRLRQMTGNGTGTANGTEMPTGGGYTAGAGAPTVTFAAATADAVSAAAVSSTVVTILNAPAATIVGVELWDSAATPKRKWYGALASPKYVAAGDTISYTAGAVRAALGV